MLIPAKAINFGQRSMPNYNFLIFGKTNPEKLTQYAKN